MNDRRSAVEALWDSIGDDYGSVGPFLVETAEILVEMAQLRSGERVIDLGTGNGHGLIPAARAVAPAVVVGVDISDVMLGAARARARAAGVDNIDLRNMDVTALDFAAEHFDVALASTVLQFVGFSPVALAEWRRVLVAGGRLLASAPVSLGSVFDDLTRDFFTRLPPAIQEPWRSAIGTSGRIEVPDLVQACVGAGFASATTEDLRRIHTFKDVDSWWAFHWTHGSRAFLKQLPADALEEMRSEATRRLAPMTLPSGEVPMETTMRICKAVA
jgi:SAM-dependent methyltransferase